MCALMLELNKYLWNIFCAQLCVSSKTNWHMNPLYCLCFNYKTNKKWFFLASIEMNLYSVQIISDLVFFLEFEEFTPEHCQKQSYSEFSP